MTEVLSENKRARKRHLIEFLVRQEEPTNEEEAAELEAEWELRDYQLIRETYRYNKEHVHARPE